MLVHVSLCKLSSTTASAAFATYASFTVSIDAAAAA